MGKQDGRADRARGNPTDAQLRLDVSTEGRYGQVVPRLPLPLLLCGGILSVAFCGASAGASSDGSSRATIEASLEDHALAHTSRAPGRVLRASTRRVSRIGRWNPTTHPNYRSALRRFGRVNRERGGDGDACRVRWPKIGLTVLFANFGGYDACDPRYGRAQKAWVSGRAARRHGWRTWNGVMIGSSLTRLRRRHPSAYRRGHSWWIATGYSPYGACPSPGCPIPHLKAVVKRKRVKGFVMWIGAAGD